MLLPLAIAASAWLARADSAIGVYAARDAVLRIIESRALYLADESDRSYGPYAMYPLSDTVWVDPRTGVERAAFPDGTTSLRTSRATFVGGTPATTRAHAGAWINRAFDPWAVLAEWRTDTTVRLAGQRVYRDYARAVLTRRGRFGTDTLLLDAKSAIPVALARIEAHYFLGPIHVLYDYETWSDVGRRALYPGSITRLVDGQLDESRFINPYGGGGVLVPADSGPSLVVPDTTVTLPIDPQHRFTADPLDTVAVGSGTYLLVNKAFTSVVSLQRDTVFVFDSPGGEDRARLEHERVGQLFTGHHATVFVALNPVWPHIAGLRYWVAHGATVVASRPIVPFLRSVLARRWTELPDDYERTRVQPTIRAVADSALLAGGQVRLYPMDGIEGETVLLAYIAPSRFVWATDHIQDTASDNILVREVRQTVAHHELNPLATSGPHFRVIPWKTDGPAATVDEFMAAISGPAGQKRDRAHIHSLLHPQARYWYLLKDSVGTTDPHKALDEAIDGWEHHGFFESCAHHETQTWGHWAQVECTYEIRRSPDAPVAVRGTDSAQLAYDGGRWKILSLFWESESETERIPQTLR